MNDKSLSEYVKQMRKEHNLTQVELSEKSGVGMKMAIPFNMIQPTLNPAMRNLSASHCQSRKSHIQV